MTAPLSAPDAAPPVPDSDSSAGLKRRAIAIVASPETVAVLLLIGALIGGSYLSADFLHPAYLIDSTSLYMETGIMALAMTFVIISGNIDLSVAANLALTAVLCAELNKNLHVPMALVVLAAPVIGGLLGLFNGVLITTLRLPSLTVTLGTLALYRGLAQVIVGDSAISDFPDWFIGVDQRSVAGLLPLPLVIFLVLALACAFVLHKTTFGRSLYALGTNEPASRFSGIQTRRIKRAVFVMTGAAAGLASMILVSRVSAVQYDLADGQELAVITAVVLGGTDIFGGRGTIFGTVIAVVLLGVIRCAMGVATFHDEPIRPEYQMVVTGSLLIFAVILCRVLARIGNNKSF